MKKLSSLLICIMLVLVTNAQIFLEGGAGLTNLYPSYELQAGYRVKNIVSSVGYIAPIDGGQPTMFNLRTGYLFDEQLYIYGSLVHLNYKQYDPRENWNTGQLGMQFHYGHGIKGTFYTGAAYTFNKTVTITFGMSFNLSKGLNCKL